ncbi:hypothetical protein ABW19_dt0207238 [Dactylella cylindrospora]|nr:hypothetical protein ABW19_dt0207238 [Dactylella cylindrospora]
MSRETVKGGGRIRSKGKVLSTSKGERVFTEHAQLECLVDESLGIGNVPQSLELVLDHRGDKARDETLLVFLSSLNEHLDCGWRLELFAVNILVDGAKGNSAWREGCRLWGLEAGVGWRLGNILVRNVGAKAR